MTTARMSSRRSVRWRVGHVLEVEAHVHLDAADRREVVAVEVEQQALEQGLGLLQRRRLARAHDAVDVEQRLFTVGVLVGRQRVADVGADIDVVDGERRQDVDVVLLEQVEHRLGDLLACCALGTTLISCSATTFFSPNCWNSCHLTYLR